MLSIVKYLNGGVTLKDIMEMDLDDFYALKHAVVFLGEKEKKELDKLKKK